MSKYKVKDCETDGFPETRGRARKFPFSDLMVDECFDVPIKDGVTLQSLATNARYWKKKLNKQAKARGEDAKVNFAVRTYPEHGFIRVKRTS